MKSFVNHILFSGHSFNIFLQLQSFSFLSLTDSLADIVSFSMRLLWLDMTLLRLLIQAVADFNRVSVEDFMEE